MSPQSGSKRGGRARRKPMGEINVVPYIDVTLVLLIIFMITTPMLQTGVKVDLPHAQSSTVEQEVQPIVITIDKDYQYFINERGDKDDPIQPEDIFARVAAVLSNQPETPVLINADETVSYGKVVAVMAALKNAGVPNVGLLTDSNEQ